jgi:hypothetical protein
MRPEIFLFGLCRSICCCWAEQIRNPKIAVGSKDWQSRPVRLTELGPLISDT